MQVKLKINLNIIIIQCFVCNIKVIIYDDLLIYDNNHTFFLFIFVYV